MKKVLQILTLVMIILTIVKISDTYAKYYTVAHGTTNQELAKWTINVQDVDIYKKGGESVQFIVDKIDNFTNPYADSDKISPGSTGYIDIIVNPKGTEVAIRYDIEIDKTKLVGLTLKTNVEVKNRDNEIIKTDEDKYTGIITLQDIRDGNYDQLRCYFTWENDDQNNDADTKLVEEYGMKQYLPIRITFTQYLGEKII